MTKKALVREVTMNRVATVTKLQQSSTDIEEPARKSQRRFISEACMGLDRKRI